jgi:hypothetical protein
VHQACQTYGNNPTASWRDLHVWWQYLHVGGSVIDPGGAIFKDLVRRAYADQPSLVPADAQVDKEHWVALSSKFKLVHSPKRYLGWDSPPLVFDYKYLLQRTTSRPEWRAVVTAFHHMMDLRLSLEFLHSVGITWSERWERTSRQPTTRLAIHLPRILHYLSGVENGEYPWDVRTVEDQVAADAAKASATSLYAMGYVEATNNATNRFADYRFLLDREPHASSKSMVERRITVPYEMGIPADGVKAHRYQLNSSAIPLYWFNTEEYAYHIPPTIYVLPIENFTKALPKYLAKRKVSESAARKIATKKRTGNGVSSSFFTSVKHTIPAGQPCAGLEVHASRTSRVNWVSIPEALFSYIDPALTVTYSPSERVRGYAEREGATAGDFSCYPPTVTAFSLYTYLVAQYGESGRRSRFRLLTTHGEQRVYFRMESRNAVRTVLRSLSGIESPDVTAFMTFAIDLLQDDIACCPWRYKKAQIANAAMGNVLKRTKLTITQEELDALRQLLENGRAEHAVNSSYRLWWSDKDWDAVLASEPFKSHGRTRLHMIKFITRYNNQVIKDAVAMKRATIEDRLAFIEKYRLCRYAPVVTKEVLLQFLVAYSAAGNSIGDYANMVPASRFKTMLERYQARQAKNKNAIAALKALKASKESAETVD